MLRDHKLAQHTTLLINHGKKCFVLANILVDFLSFLPHWLGLHSFFLPVLGSLFSEIYKMNLHSYLQICIHVCQDDFIITCIVKSLNVKCIDKVHLNMVKMHVMHARITLGTEDQQGSG